MSKDCEILGKLIECQLIGDNKWLNTLWFFIERSTVVCFATL